MQRGARAQPAAAPQSSELPTGCLTQKLQLGLLPDTEPFVFILLYVCGLSVQKVTVSSSPNSPKSDVSATTREKVGPDASVGLGTAGALRSLF